MSGPIFEYLRQFDSFIWDYVAFILIILLGCCLTFHARAFQVRALPSIVRSFISLFTQPSDPKQRGVHPLKAFFASVGGMIGIGNVVGIVTAVQIGGPGALIWVWVAAFVGTIVKYSEIFLGLKYRVKNEHGGYDGGPMYFLQQAFKNRWLPPVVALLLCVYGVEIYQFAVVTDSLSANLGFNRPLVIAGLLALVVYASVGGIARVGKICSWVMPFFVSIYMVMGLWIIFSEATLLPEVLYNAFVSAFTGHAAVGGFAGSTVMLAIQHGVARAAYSGDIGIGYDSIIQSESSTVYPERQARLAILGVCIDNIICTVSILIVLLSGVWTAIDPIEGSLLVQTALSHYFPYMHIFMPLFLFIAGYTTMIAYFCVGIKCARFLHPRYGSPLYLAYAVSAWVFFSFFDQSQAMLVMSLAGAMLLITNLIGIFLLRHQIVFAKEEYANDVLATASMASVAEG
jgi:AGCS family alanine or glycine:cation symporter